MSKKCNSLLLESVHQLERASLDNSQYLRRDMIELQPVPLSIDEKELETTICKVLSLTGPDISSSSLQSCHRLTNKNTVIVKFTDRKVRHNVIVNRRKLKDKSGELSELGFKGKL